MCRTLAASAVRGVALGEFGDDGRRGPGVAPIAGQVAAFGGRHRLLEDFQRRPQRFGQPPAIGARFEMRFDFLVPSFRRSETDRA